MSNGICAVHGDVDELLGPINDVGMIVAAADPLEGMCGRIAGGVKIRLHTENQLPTLPGSALKVPVWWVVWWVPTHY